MDRRVIRRIRHESTIRHSERDTVNGGHPVLGRELDDLCPIDGEDAFPRRHNGIGSFRGGELESRCEVFARANVANEQGDAE